MDESPRRKLCSKCKRELPTSAFAKRSRSKDGLQPWCRQCNQAKTLEPQYKTKPLKQPDFDPSVFLEQFISCIRTCVWCREPATSLIADGKTLSPTEDVIQRTREADAWCGTCARREGVRSRIVRKNRFELIDAFILEVLAWHDVYLVARSNDSVRRSLGDRWKRDKETGEIIGEWYGAKGHEVAFEAFMMRASLAVRNYFEVVERFPVLSPKQRKEITKSEVSTTEQQFELLDSGQLSYDPTTRKYEPTATTIDY